MRGNSNLDWEGVRRDIAAVQGDGNDEDGRRKARARWLATAKTEPRARTWVKGRSFWALALAASVALAVTGWLRLRPAPALTFETTLPADSSGALPKSTAIRFSDGSSWTLIDGAVARVTDTSSAGATVVLDDGALHAAVVHRPAGKWRVAAGPFTVLVTGTKFDVRWRPVDQTFELELHEGAVTILGPSLGDGGRHLSAGERIRISIPDEAMRSPSAPDTARVQAAESPSPQLAPSGAHGPATGARVSWKQLALEERYAEALTVAETEHFDVICRGASAPDLLLLANTARFAGSAKRAETAFRSLRARFPGTHEAALAAFSMGRIAYDEHRNFRDAADWFRRYLADEPGGILAREASGRLIEAYRSAGDVAEARQSAKAYLAKYPSGPHAAVARGVLEP
jgi:TolA-binding protein